MLVGVHGGPEVLKWVLRQTPEPGPGEVAIRTEAAGVAYADLLMRAGRYPGGPKPPFTPGWDVLGVVEAVGSGVDAGWVGARVLALVLTGGYAERVIAPAARTVRLPDDVEPLQAACLTMNYVTALQMLRLAGAREGQTLLVYGAAGGVGSALLDLARSQGLIAWGAVSPSGRATVEAYGGRYVDRTQAEPGEAVRRNAGGVDIVFDPLGGPNTRRSFAALRPGGVVVSYGFMGTSGRAPRLDALRQMLELKLRSLGNGKRGVFYRLSGSAVADPTLFRADLRALLALLAEGLISPRIAGVLPLAEAAEAHRRLEHGAIAGRLLLVNDRAQADAEDHRGDAEIPGGSTQDPAAGERPEGFRRRWGGPVRPERDRDSARRRDDADRPSDTIG
jgi:NADPH2:quinone reductase